MSLLQSSSLFMLVTFIAMVVAVPHEKFNASRIVMGSETSTSTPRPWYATSSLTSQADNTTEGGLNSSKSNARASSTIFNLSNISTPAFKPAMIDDNNENKAEAHEEGGNVKITGGGVVEVSITELSIGVCLGNCYNDLQICYEAVDSSSGLPRTICGIPGQYGLRFGTVPEDPSYIWLMEEEKNIAMRTDVAECKFARIKPGNIEFVHPKHRLSAANAGCAPRIVPGGYMKIIVKGASENCPVLIKDAKLKPEPTTVAPTPEGGDRTTEEASNAELYIGLGVGGLILFIIIVVVIISVLCWKKRQNKTKQQSPPAKSMKALMDKPVEDSGPGEAATLVPVEAKPAMKEEKALIPLDHDVEKAEPVVKEEKTLAPVDHDVEKAEPAPMKPQVIIEAKKTQAVEVVEEAKLVKDAKETVKERSLVVDETQKDESEPRKAASKKKSKSKKKKNAAKVAAPPPPPLPIADAAATKEDAPSKEAPPPLPRPVPATPKKVNHLYDDYTQKSSPLRPGDIYHWSIKTKTNPFDEKKMAHRERLSHCPQKCLRNLELLGSNAADYERMERFYPHIRERKVLDMEKELFAGTVDDMVLQMEALCERAHLILVDEGFRFNADLKFLHVSRHGRDYLMDPSTPYYVHAFAFGAKFELHVQHAPIHCGKYSLPLLFIVIMTPRIPRDTRIKACNRLLNCMFGDSFEGVYLASKCFPVNFIRDIREYRQKKEEAALKKASNETYESKETHETE